MLQSSTLQFGLIAEPVPWFLPGVLIAGGLLLYGTPYVDFFLQARLVEWRGVPRFARLAITALFVGGAGVTVLSVLGNSFWMYVLFLLGYARAIEAITTLYLFGRLDDLMNMLSGDNQGSGSLVSKAVSWFVDRLMKRLSLTIVTATLSAISLGLYVSVLIAFPDAGFWTKLVFAFTLSTFYLSTVNAAWVLTKLTDEIGPGAFVGLILCIVGGEMYNVPSAFAVFTDQPALSGPMGAVTTLTVGTIGWLLGLMLALIFFYHRIQTTEPPRMRQSERRRNW